MRKSRKVQKELTSAEKAEQQHEADLALDALRKAVAAGLKNAATLCQNTDLAVLQERTDFKLLLLKVSASPVGPVRRFTAEEMADYVAAQQKQAAADPDNRHLQADLAASQHALALVLLGQSRLDEAAQAVRQALRKRLVAAHPRELQWQADLAASQQVLAEVLVAQGKLEESIQTFKRALSVRESLAQDEPKNALRNAELADAWMTLGSLHWQKGHIADGARSWQKAARVLEAVANPQADAQGALETSARWRTLGLSYVKAGLWGEAAVCFERFPVEDWHGFLAAMLQLRTGNLARYRQTCTVLCKIWEKGKKAAPGYLIWACTLDSRAGVDVEQLYRSAIQMEEAYPSRISYFLCALASYRAGRFEEAFFWAMRADRAGLGPASHMGLPVIALAQHRLQHADQALKSLEQANQEWRRLSPLARSIQAENVLPLGDPSGSAWHEWIVFEILLAEANASILGHRGEVDCLDLLHRAYLHTKLGETGKADELFEAAVLGRARDQSAWTARGHVYLLLGDRKRAEADLARAEELNPDGLYLVACAHARSAGSIGSGKQERTSAEKARRQHEADLALDALSKAVAAGLKDVAKLTDNPDFAVLRERMGFTALLVKLAAGAGKTPAVLNAKEVAALVAAQQQQAAADPDNRHLQADLAASQHVLAMIFFGQGKRDEAQQHLDHAVALREALVRDEPMNAEYQAALAASRGYLHLLRARRLAEQKQHKEAKALLARTEPFAFNDARAYRERGRLYFELGQTDRADADFRKAVVLLDLEAVLKLVNEPAGSDADRQLARVADDYGLLSKLFTALENNPNDQLKRWDRGEWYARHRRWKEAAADFQHVVELQPLENRTVHDSWHWLHAAPTLVAAGDQEGHRRLCAEMLRRFGSTHTCSR